MILQSTAVPLRHPTLKILQKMKKSFVKLALPHFSMVLQYTVKPKFWILVPSLICRDSESKNKRPNAKQPLQLANIHYQYMIYQYKIFAVGLIFLHENTLQNKLYKTLHTYRPTLACPKIRVYYFFYNQTLPIQHFAKVSPHIAAA